MKQPDGMGADRYRERQNMKQAQQVDSLFSYDVVALDTEGNVVYETESCATEEEARDCAAELNSSRNSYIADAPEEVVRFGYRER